MTKSRVLATVQELETAGTIRFKYRDEGIEREGFLVYFKNQVAAYENVCRHIPLSLDNGDGQFFSQHGTHLLCHTHGATYDPLSGICIEGPCVGASLKRISVKVEDDAIMLVGVAES
jgi:nitrite reductase/ring-hydroxylating ferredoxin subunit